MVAENLKRYEWAALAGSIYKDRGSYAIEAMRSLYEGFGLDRDDFILQRAFADAEIGLKNGQITNAGVFGAMAKYSEKFAKAFDETTIGDFRDYVAERGYTDLPEQAKELLEKYKTSKISELEKELKDAVKARKQPDKEKVQVIGIVETLRNQVMEGILYSKLVEKRTKESLEEIVREEPAGNSARNAA